MDEGKTRVRGLTNPLAHVRESKGRQKTHSKKKKTGQTKLKQSEKRGRSG